MTRTLVLLSGGVDSTALIAHYRERGDSVGTLSINYGQRHRRELAAAARVADSYGLPHQTAELGILGEILTGSALTDPSIPVPEGAYDQDTMRTTVVPNRNMILMSVAVGAAVARGYDRVAIGAHTGDHHVYADCRPNFLRAFSLAAGLAVEDCAPPEFTVAAPFMHLPKWQIVLRAADMGAPLHHTWSCYVGGAMHCGLCGTCVERREAFALAAVPDPATYAADNQNGQNGNRERV